MILVTKENIYGLDVYRFASTKRIPYQLVFDDTINPNHTEISLVNLLGGNDATYCNQLRRVVSEIIYEYLSEKKCTLYFDFKLDDRKGTLLLKKFIRWIKLEPRVTAEAEITPFQGGHFIEFKIKINKTYINSLKVNLK